MPELPEVETIRRGLAKQLPGRTVLAAQVLRPDSIGHPGAEDFARQVVGHRILSVDRRGKYLMIRLDREAGLSVHLRMSGRLIVVPSKKKKDPGPHVRVIITMDGGGELWFEDMRVFGRIWYVPPGEAFEDVVSGLADLGIEPLDGALNGKFLKNALANRNQPIKSALLDQTVIAGIGNIYADETLHLSKVKPNKPSNSLSSKQYDLLAENIRAVLSRAIGLGGSSIRNYVDAEGVNGNYQHIAFVYGREGEPCLTCKTKITRIKLAGRSAHFCPRCQR
jgi:formamidopyrimidine-DNA glycosylase